MLEGRKDMMFGHRRKGIARKSVSLQAIEFDLATILACHTYLKPAIGQQQQESEMLWARDVSRVHTLSKASFL